MATNRIISTYKDKPYDVKSRKLLSLIKKHSETINLKDIFSASSYLISSALNQEQLQLLIDNVFCDPIIEIGYLNSYPNYDFDYALEIGFKPGVTDNVGKSCEEAIKDTFPEIKDVAVFTSKIYFFKLDGHSNTPNPEQNIQHLARNHLYNELIERCKLIFIDDWKSGIYFSNELPVFNFTKPNLFNYIELKDKTDEELIAISDEKLLSLNLEELKTIQTYYNNKNNHLKRHAVGLGHSPTDVELEVLAQTWSEHCKHKIFAADIIYDDGNGHKIEINSLYKTYVQQATKNCDRSDLLSVFTDNAGVFKFDEEHAICLKTETHNSPSALDPYGGAMTGIVGVNRDIMGTGLGAKPIFNTNVFCFGPPDYQGVLPPKRMHPRRIFNGVHLGVRDGGNESGIPTINGAILFEERFIGKPLVFCGTGGLLPLTINGQSSYQKRANPGDLIIMAGGRIGKDGIHGATFSSVALTTSSPTSAVQIGDPITQKKLLDFLLQARDLGLYTAITDNGAGGLSSSIGEMAEAPGGCIIELDKAPLKYKGLAPWEILISEAQERMTLAVNPSKWNELQQLAKQRSVEITNLGTFNDSGVFEARYEDKLVCYLDLKFMHQGLPKMQLKATWRPTLNTIWDVKTLTKNPEQVLLNLLARPNIASKEHWVRQYDHEVQGQSVVKPFEGIKEDGPSDASVLKPLPDHNKGLGISNGINPFYSDIDTYHMATNAVDEAVRNLVAVGVDPKTIVALDNFCWPDPVQSIDTPDGEYKLAQLVRANQGLRDVCEFYNVPLISGKDSMKNDYGKGKNKISIPPTLLITASGTLPDVHKTVTSFFKRDKSYIFLLGTTKRELGGSELARMERQIDSSVPIVDFEVNKRLYNSLFVAIEQELILSCHDLSEGGLAVGLAEMCIGGRIGCDISLDSISIDLAPIEILYSESAGRFIVEVDRYKVDLFKDKLANLPIVELGTVTDSKSLAITYKDANYLSIPVKQLVQHWKNGIKIS